MVAMTDIREVYENMWRDARPALLASQAVDFERAAANASATSHIKRTDGARKVSAVALPDSAAIVEIDKLIDVLRPLFGDNHAYFSAENYHSTIHSIDVREDNMETFDSVLVYYAETVRALANELPPIEVRYEGLTATRFSLILRGYPANDSLARMRERLANRLSASPHEGFFKIGNPRDTAHLTLAVASASEIKDPVALCAFIDAHRDEPLIRAGIRSVELREFAISDAMVAMKPVDLLLP